MLFTAVVATLLSFQAQADEGTRYRPMIQVGSGIESALNSGGVNLLMRVNVGLRSHPEDEEPGDIVGPEQLIWAHITGDLAFDVADTSATALPYMDLKIVPVQNQLAILRENGGRIMGDLQILPVEIARDVRIDQALALKVSVVGLQFGIQNATSEQVAVFAQVAADAIGYKLASHVSDLGTFHGFHFATIAAEGGIGLFPKTGPDGEQKTYQLRIAIGGNADLNLGHTSGTGFSVQSDMRAYLAVRANITKFVELFVRGGLNSTCNSDQRCWITPQFLAGATFIFDSLF